ncbi:hypothetical protein [Thermogemmatispora carboxidivorans]|uniref:hypothetical protein n=1 Tax=Thermogemmatispora carboxidivorans TaxID=1382306 RepID=UPI00069AD7C4|nr:hypothetical protein [Thermogemmatispora carboxidivorans]
MLDDMFSFIDPVFSTDEDSLSEFIIQMEAFVADTEKKGKVLGNPPRPLTEEVFKEMWMLRYQQHLGQITFEELLSKYEEILGIASPSDSEQF